MVTKYLSTGLIIALSIVLCVPAKAQSSPGIGFPSGPIGCACAGEIIGGAIGVVAGIAVITIVAIHYSKKRTITGCVVPRGSRMTVTDEKNQQTYDLFGNTAGVAPGERMKLEGKKVKSGGPDKTLAWKAKKVAKDYGACHP